MQTARKKDTACSKTVDITMKRGKSMKIQNIRKMKNKLKKYEEGFRQFRRWEENCYLYYQKSREIAWQEEEREFYGDIPFEGTSEYEEFCYS